MISLSKDKHSKEYYKIKSLMLPIRHMAHECIAMVEKIKYTAATDVYSCGITIWEILTHGKMIPFESMSNDEVYQKLQAKSIDFEILLKHEGISTEIKAILVS
jgi:serine/threonine protein kinase